MRDLKGRFVKGYVPSKETRRKLSLAKLGEKHPLWGKEHSEKTKRKLSIANTGKNHPMWGKKHSEKTKRKIGLVHKGKKVSEESRIKMSLIRKGRNVGIKHPNWKGGRKNSIDGYILVYAPDHYYKIERNYVKEHRLVMEKHLGRYLKPKEVVHHKGIEYPIGSIENKQDNRIKNLQLFENSNKHLNYHRRLKRRNKK